MLVDAATATNLKPWLIRTLEPICDAEPGALADYVLALLSHDAPDAELRKELTTQLDEFLEKECPRFVDTLFTALRTRSYLPYTAEHPTQPSFSTVDNGIPIPHDGYITHSNLGPRKRGLDDGESQQPPPKGPRLNNHDHFSRHGGPSDWDQDGNRNGRHSSNGMGVVAASAMNGYPETKRGICRDYYHKGFCARGAYCKFSHGDDAVVPAQMVQMNGMPFIPMFQTGAMGFNNSSVSYDPTEAQMDMRRFPENRPIIDTNDGRANSHTPRNPPSTHMGGEEGDHRAGEVIKDLTPRQTNAPSAQTARDDVQMSDVSSSYNRQHTVASSAPRGGRGPRSGPPGDRTKFDGERPSRRQEKTLVVEKLPEDKLSLDAINAWFKKFGTITNVAIDVHGAKALVSYATHEEAHAAWKSQEAVFGNRFVKLFWHRPIEGHGQVGSRMLAASAPRVATVNKELVPRVITDSTSQTISTTPGPSSTSSQPARPVKSAAVMALAAKQEILEQKISEQKALMAKLHGASPSEKADIMARFKELSEEMAKMSQETPIPPPAPAKTKHAPIQPDEPQLPTTTADEEEVDASSSEDLKTQLAKLKAEAASLGISDTADVPGSSTQYRPYRGRGRFRGSRGYYRGGGRGGSGLASFSLDNRPKKLLIKGAEASHTAAIRDWYETTGALDTMERDDNGDIVVSFRTRLAAEQGLAKGRKVPLVGEVQISWHMERPFNQKAESTAAPVDESLPELEVTHIPTHMPVTEDGYQEEVTAGGWGDEDDRM